MKPGGWIELQEFNPRIGCDDGSVPPDYPLQKFYDQLQTVFWEHYGFDLRFIEKAPACLEKLGFVNIQQRVFHLPIGAWPKDQHLRTLGAYFREVFAEMIPAMTASAFPEFGIDALETNELMQSIQVALGNRRFHSYVPVHFVWAQKPVS